MSEHFWPGSDPVGMRIVLDKSEPRTIIGVVGDVKSTSLDEDPETELYLPFAEQPAPYVGLVLRSSSDPQLLTANIRTSVRQIDANQPITQVATMQEMIEEFFDRPRFALTLSIVGLYAMVSLGSDGSNSNRPPAGDHAFRYSTKRHRDLRRRLNCLAGGLPGGHVLSRTPRDEGRSDDCAAV